MDSVIEYKSRNARSVNGVLGSAKIVSVPGELDGERDCLQKEKVAAHRAGAIALKVGRTLPLCRSGLV